nr:putative reverse transcriptase domain-containing protein [Tanacetum cinerariifolium]
MPITGVLGQSWRSSTDWLGIDSRNNGKDRTNQAKNPSCSGSTKELHGFKTEADGVQKFIILYESNLKKCYADKPLVMPLEGIHVDDRLQFVEEPVEIMEREIKRLKRSQIPLVKVCWNSKRGPEFTWEREDSFRKKYPHLFTNRATSSAARA